MKTINLQNLQPIHTLYPPTKSIQEQKWVSITKQHSKLQSKPKLQKTPNTLKQHIKRIKTTEFENQVKLNRFEKKKSLTLASNICLSRRSIWSPCSFAAPSSCWNRTAFCSETMILAAASFAVFRIISAYALFRAVNLCTQKQKHQIALQHAPEVLANRSEKTKSQAISVSKKSPSKWRFFLKGGKNRVVS